MSDVAIMHSRTETIDNKENWWEYYGLVRDPFSRAINQNAFYLPNDWEQHIDLLQLLVRHSHEMLLIQGSPGSGKTTLIEQFIEQLDSSLPLCRIVGNSVQNNEELLETISSCFDLPLADDFGASVRVQLNALVEEIIQREERCLLIVDDADQLPVPVLQALCYLQRQRWEHQAPLAIIMLLTDNFANNLFKIGENYLDKNMLKSLQLKTFELHEVEHYLEQRFTAAGFTGELPLSREELLHIQQESAGVPNNINKIAEQILINNLAEQAEASVSVSYWQENKYKFMGGVFLLIILACIFYLWEMRSVNINLAEQTAETNQPNNTTPTSLAKIPITEQTNTNNNVNNSPAPAPVAVSTVPTPEVIQNAHALLQYYVTQPSTLQVAAQAIATRAVQQVSELSKKQTVNVAIAKPIPKPISKPISQTTPAKHLAVHSAAEKDLLKMPAHEYTIQLVGVYHLTDLHKYLQAHHRLPKDLRYFKTKFNGKDWYVLVHGRYKTVAEAKKALLALPKPVRHETKPWVRSFASVQEAIKSGRVS